MDTLILTAVLDTQSCQKMQQLQFLILLNRCMQLQLAEFTAAHPGYETIRSALNGWDNLQNLDNQRTNPISRHQAGHNLRVLMQIDFTLLATPRSNTSSSFV